MLFFHFTFFGCDADVALANCGDIGAGIGAG
jgi:hypothetical protein